MEPSRGIALEAAMNRNQELFHLQANSDLRMFDRLRGMVATGEIEACHGLHFLQMATEKLSKAYFLRSNVRRSHKYFSKFWCALPTVGRIRRELRYADSKTFRDDILSVAGLVSRIEQLAPDLADEGPNPEYPWPYPNYQHAPGSYHFAIWGRITHGHDGQLLVRLVHSLADAAPRCF
jgi:hypothetical protein